MKAKTNVKAGSCKEQFDPCEKDKECCSKKCEYGIEGFRACQ
jgi:hypothetical protein